MSNDVLVFVGIALFVGVAVLWYWARNREAVPQFILDILPDQLEFLIMQAVQYATLFVEKVDTEGHLDQFFDEIKDKSAQKLELAVDVASERLEEYITAFFLERGIELNVDIPEGFIKDVIQRYVWQNPNLFPSRGKELTDDAGQAGQAGQSESDRSAPRD